MSQHTPGPWKLSVETMLSSTSKRVVTADNKFVLRIEGADFGREEDRANARLIAAAPDLLSALRGLLDWGLCNLSPVHNPDAHQLLVTADAAIAKAEGRAK